MEGLCTDLVSLKEEMCKCLGETSVLQRSGTESAQEWVNRAQQHTTHNKVSAGECNKSAVFTLLSALLLLTSIYSDSIYKGGQRLQNVRLQ